ncbi:MAG: hypothetical protein NUV98_06485, partial [Candidatus Roizmanbacteria bacterium]|nr:hypothetical protein [Candidatus Roizmanbacteria bacterium]
MWRIIKKACKSIAVSFFILAIFLAGFPSSVLLERITQTIADRNVVDVLYRATKDSNVVDKGFANLLRPRVDKAQAATYAIQTGTYVGSGTSKAITGLGFSPQAVIIKSNTTA